MHIDADQMTTFYCGSTFDPEKHLDHSLSGFAFYKDEKRASRIEWEHVVPAYAFGHALPEWLEGHPDCVKNNGKPYKGRDCAEKTNKQFQFMQADMYNLRPAIGEVNGRRSNYSFAMLDGEKRIFGICNMEIENQKAEPPDERMGDIARTYFYMDTAYPGLSIISGKNEKLFAAWDAQDPVDAWECERAQRIQAIQGFLKTSVPEGPMPIAHQFIGGNLNAMPRLVPPGQHHGAPIVETAG